MKSWLDSDPHHVVVVHCKGGKGRTGCVIASFMNYSQICQRYSYMCIPIANSLIQCTLGVCLYIHVHVHVYYIFNLIISIG